MTEPQHELNPRHGGHAAEPQPEGERVFRREGEYWTIALEGTTFRLRDCKGLRYLACLLERPREPISVIALSETGEEGRSLRRHVPLTANTEHPNTLLSERARVAVTKRIRASMQKIAAHHPSLGRHLATTIKTGQICVYVPDPTRPVVWRT